jgi:hypothetical protein
MKPKQLWLIALLLLFSSSLQAQVRRYRLSKQSNLERAYMDSLTQYRDSLFADTVAAPIQLSQQSTAPLFLPLTFYKNIAHNALSLDKELSPLDKQLLDIYLMRPDMVQNTETQLEKTGPVVAPQTVVEEPTATMVKPKPEEPDVIPVDMVVLKPNFWKFSGDYYLQFLQNYISGNWYKGGESNYSLLGSLTLEANYNNKQKVKWDNKLEMKLGLQTSKSDSLHKVKSSEDLLRYTGKLGLQATKKWYYTLQLVAYTQFLRTYEKNQEPVVSDFMSPFNANLSLGMDYTIDWLNHHLTGSVHLAPLSYNFKYVGRLALSTRYGLDEGKHTLNDFGSQLTLDMKWKFSDNISWQTRLYGYTTYERSEIEWENTFTFQFNKYISAKFFIYPRFDDNTSRDDHHGYWQFKEYTSLGFSYSF